MPERFLDSEGEVSDLHLLTGLWETLSTQWKKRVQRDTRGHGEINGQLWCFKMLKNLSTAL